MGKGWYAAAGAVGLALVLVVVGFFILLATAVWVLYRAIRGWVELAEGKPAPIQARRWTERLGG